MRQQLELPSNIHSVGSKYNDKKLTKGVKIPYGKLNPGSKYHVKIDPVVNLPWGSKYHMTPGVNHGFREEL